MRLSSRRKGQSFKKYVSYNNSNSFQFYEIIVVHEFVIFDRRTMMLKFWT